jgi:hypothetical protein
MRYSLSLAALAATASAQETVIGAYIFSRHGDRTAKSTPPANLTDLGYEEIFTSGTWFRNRYISGTESTHIHGMNTDLVKQSQITVSAPVDTVLQNSAMAFTQALYPPVGETLGSQALRNGTVVQTPLNGYQLIPVQVVSTGANSENSAWLQGSTNCANAQTSSNNYFMSEAYNTTLSNTRSFYSGVYPMVERTFAQNATNFKNAYTIFDLLNVASIHNSSNNFPSSDLLTEEIFFQLRTLADQHELNLAYNASDPIRAVTGSIIAAQVLTALNTTLTGKGKSKLNVQFGAYAGMSSYFGLAGLLPLNVDFNGVADYASTLTWELVTNSTVSEESFPTMDEVSVRFMFHNGTTSSTSIPTEYPLFGSGRSPLPWNDFVTGMNKFAIGTQKAWCTACGNSTGVCSAESLADGSGQNSTSSGGLDGASSNSTSSSGHSGMSLAVAGVIGAMVTLAVILGIEGLILLIGGLRLVSKKKFAGNGAGTGAVKA